QPEWRLRRIGLGLLAVASVATVVERHLVVESIGIAPDVVMALVIVGTLPLLSVARLRPATRDALATGLALAAFSLTAMALLLGKGYHVDAVTVPHHAAEELLAGQDPYKTFDLPEALAEFGLDPQLVTHYTTGSPAIRRTSRRSTSSWSRPFFGSGPPTFPGTISAESLSGF